MKAILLNSTLNWYHWGCTGTSTALKEQIEALHFELISIPINATYSCQNIPKTLKEFKCAITFDNFAKLNTVLIEQIKSVDVVIINGEGTLHGMSEGARALLYLAYISKAYLKKSTQIINHSVYPQDSLNLDDDATVKLYQTVYQSLDFVAIRETLSATLMQQLHIPVTESFDCLPLFIRDHYKKRPEKKSSSKRIVIAGSGAWFKEGLFEKFKPALVQFIQYMDDMIAQGFTIEVLVGAKAYPARDDEEWVSYLQANKPEGWTLINARSMEEWLNTLATATLLISGRFHHTIAAACLNTPYIAFASNTPKVDSVLKMLNGDRTLSYHSSSLLEELHDRTKQALTHPPGIQHFSLERLCEQAMANFEGLAKLACAKKPCKMLRTRANLFQIACANSPKNKEEMLDSLAFKSKL